MPRYSRKRRSVKVSTLLRKKIKKVIAGVAEKKGLATLSSRVSSFYNGLTAVSSADGNKNGYWGGFNSVGPSGGTSPFVTLVELTTPLRLINRGSSSNQRIGDQIMLSKLYMECVLRSDAAATGPCITTVFVVSLKQTPMAQQGYTPTTSPGGVVTYNVAGPGGVVTTNFLRTGDGVTGPTGLLTDLDLPVNSELFTVHYKKVFKIALNPSTAAQQYLAGFAPVRRFKLNVASMLPTRKVVWLEPTDAAPDSTAALNQPRLWLLMTHQSMLDLPANSLQSNPGGANITPLLSYTMDIKWTDL